MPTYSRHRAGWQHSLMMLLLMLSMYAWTPAIFAHASLIASVPPSGSVLSQAPSSVTLTFNEPVSPLVIKMIDPDGVATDIPHTNVLKTGLEIPLPTLIQEGAYALSWRVVSADGHPIGGTTTFSVGTRTNHSQQAATSTSTRSTLIWFARLAANIGLFFGIGLALCYAWSPTLGNKRPLGLGLLTVGVLATVLSIGLLGLDALDQPLSALFSVSPWHTAYATSFGLSAVLALMALVCTSCIWYVRPPTVQRLIALLALVITGAALASSGHASSAPPTWITKPAVWIHAMAVMLWLGSLLPLAFTLQGLTNTTHLLKLFSRFIPVVLLWLLISGGILVYVQFDTLASLWQTPYGQVLVVKLVLLAGLLGLAAYNRYRLTQAVMKGQHRARSAMRRIIYIECVVAVMIVAVAMLWRFTPPPRTLVHTHQASSLITVQALSHAAIADLSVKMEHGQATSLTIQLSTPTHHPLAAQEVEVSFSNPTAGIEPIVYSATLLKTGTWYLNKLELPNLSEWDVHIKALITDFDRINIEAFIKLHQ